LFNMYDTTIALDGWSITSLTDSADIKDNIIMEGLYLVLNQDNLKETLYINPEGDVINLYINAEYFSHSETLEFGKVNNSKIIAPKPYQSICRLNEISNKFYLDNTPTLSSQNDSLNAMGYLDILVTDQNGNPLQNFEILYDIENILLKTKKNDPLNALENLDILVTDYNDHSMQNDEISSDFRSSMNYPLSFFSDYNGRYLFKNYAIKQRFWLKNFQLLCSKQILPEDTLDLVIKIDTTASGINNQNTNNLPAGYLLNQNYPNPFNNTTKITFYLPQADYIEIILYDVSGKKIENLFSGYKTLGVHVFNWNADFLASGIYIYQLKTADVTLSKKCILIK
jgi:hypothetical protein